MILPLLAASCAVAVVGDDGAFVERVRGELASTVPCVAVEQAFTPDKERTVVRVVSRHTVEVWEHGALANVLRLEGSEDVDVVKIAEHVRARSVTGALPKDGASTLAAPPAGPETKPLTFAISAGIGPVVEAGAVGVGARLAARARVFGPLGAGAMLIAPLAPATVSGAQGSADISTVAAGPTIDLEIRSRSRASADSPLRSVIGVTGLFASTRATGVAASPFMGRRVSETRVVPALFAGVSYAISTQFSIELAGVAGIAVPALEVRFAESEISRWGAPYALATFGASIQF